MTGFGRSLRSEFFMEDGYTPLNHGSFGVYPKALRPYLHQYQLQAEINPDKFLRREMFPILDKNRERLAGLVHCDPQEIVFVTNASVGINSVVRSLMLHPTEKLLCFSTAYNAVERTMAYVQDALQSKLIPVQLDYPLSDDQVLENIENAIAQHHHPSSPIKLCLMDAITSVPGVRFPFERVIKLLKEHNILSLVDGAHAIGQIPLDLHETDPDFFITNCHKWLFAPRGAALLYVPRRNQYLIHPAVINASYQNHPGPKDDVSTNFQLEFSWPGTCDFSSFMCINHGTIGFPTNPGGEDKIQEYCHQLAVDGGKEVANILGTEVMENEEKTLTVAMVNVRLPLVPNQRYSENDIVQAFIDKLLYQHNCMAPAYFHNKTWYTRLSAQVYNDLDDFRLVGKALLAVCNELQ
ncbi:PLP-dependent transferase [Absidia repens]|uniref:PLP-dependent transferase n=1 Tax=Absidia repens TaxID=90262 RepID=A0A1X2I4Q6_9FUNG|nr:PLP-dependent transferase [Absidia repens]